MQQNVRAMAPALRALPHAPRLEWVWRSALAVFILAASTGALYRFGLVYGWTAGFHPVNVRHAHSHLMFFGWITPVLFALIARRVASSVGRPLPMSMQWILGGCFAAALLSYPLFLLLGYTPVALGSKHIPLAVVGSTLNMVAWYAFVVWYRRASKGVPRTEGQLLWDAALIFLVLATLGAGGLAMLKPLGVQSDVWTSALTHIFLDFFSEGWFVLSVLGLAHYALRGGGREGGHWSIYLLCLGLPLTFAMGMPSRLVTPGLNILARVGGVLIAVGLLANVRLLWPATATRERWLWRVPLALLTLKALGQLGGSAIPGLWLADVHGMRILYLHLMLLGFVSLGLIAAAGHEWGRDTTRGCGWMYLAVCMVLASLVPLSPLWPIALGGRWAFVLAAWLSFAPIAAAAAMLIRNILRNRARARAVNAGHPPQARPALPHAHPVPAY